MTIRSYIFNLQNVFITKSDTYLMVEFVYEKWIVKLSHTGLWHVGQYMY